MASTSETFPNDCTSLPDDDHGMVQNHIISIPREVDLMLSRKCCIYKVPEPIRQVNRQAYTPRLISIGPFHYNNKNLKSMERQKQVYFHYFWKRLRSKSNDPDVALEKLKKYKDFLAKNENEIRHHYSDKIHEIIKKGKNNFVNIILMDSVFIMELFRRNWEDNMTKHDYMLEHDYMFTKSWLCSYILMDLLLLENQLPFFVLEELHGLCFPSSNGPSFLDLALYYFNGIIQTNDKSRLRNVRHFTDLVRQTFRPSDPEFVFECEFPKNATKLKKAGITFENPQEELEKRLKKKDLNLRDIQLLFRKLKARVSPERVKDLIVEKFWDEGRASWRQVDDLREKLMEEQRIPEELLNISRITHDEVEKLGKLKEAGISFKEIQDINLLDVKFEKANVLEQLPCLSCVPYSNAVKARLQIPQFIVDDSTEYTFRNLIAYEQCHDLHEAYVCNYISLLDCLIDTEDDVDMLIHSKVIDHMLGSNQELAKLINNLCKNIIISSDCYSHIIKRLNHHYGMSWNSSIATLRSVYFHDLWRTSSTVVGVAVLVLTVVSLVRSVFS